MQTATNPETGERVVFADGRWQPFTESATNDKGEKAYMVGGQWVTASGAQKQPGGLSIGGALTKGVYTGLANVVGAPADLLYWGLEKAGLPKPTHATGSAAVKAILPASFSYENIEDIPEEVRPVARVGEVIGGAIIPAAAPFAVTRSLSQVPNLVRPIIAAARNSPVTFAAAEAGFTLGAAQGAGAAELFFPGNPAVAITGEIVGGFANPVGLATRVVRTASPGAKTVIQSFTRAGREQKAAETLQKALVSVGEDPAAVAARLHAASPEGVTLSSGQTAESPSLLAFEATIAAKNPDFDAAMRLQSKENLESLRNLVGQMAASGDPELLRVAAKVREQYFQQLLDGRMAAAQAQAGRAARAIGGDQAAASTRATQTLEDALTDARTAERALWAKVPKDESLAGSGVVDAYDAVRASMLPEEPLPPAFIRAFVERAKDGAGVTSGDIQRFRSKMLEQAREARAQKRWGDARIYSDMAEGALADLAAIPGPDAENARAFSKALNDSFTRTFAGDALAVKGTGADRIVPEAVLEKAFGSGGTMAARRFKELEGAARFTDGEGAPQFPVRTMAPEQEEFIRAAAQAAVDPQTGGVNPRALEGFLRKNADVLERFPALKRDLGTAAAAEQTFRDVTAAAKTASKAIQQRSAFAQVLGSESPVDAVRRVVASSHPQREYQNLVKLARRGPEGTVEGLKAATLDYAMSAATNATGGFSFARYQQILNQPMSGRGPSALNTMRMQGVMSTEEMSRMNALLTTAQRIERSLASKAKMSELVGEPDALFDLVVRAVGANVGGASALGQATGAPLVMAGAGSRLARNMFEKVPRTRIMDVIAEASKNPKLMAKLLEKPSAPRARAELERQINAFLIQAGLADRGGEEEEQAPPAPEVPKAPLPPQRPRPAPAPLPAGIRG